jgi:hypothetical protein
MSMVFLAKRDLLDKEPDRTQGERASFEIGMGGWDFGWVFDRSGMLGAGWSWLRKEQPWMNQGHQLDAGRFRSALALGPFSQGEAVTARAHWEFKRSCIIYGLYWFTWNLQQCRNFEDRREDPVKVASRRIRC